MSNAPLESVRINRSLVHTGSYDVKLLETILEGRSKPWKGADSVRFITVAELNRFLTGDVRRLSHQEPVQGC